MGTVAERKFKILTAKKQSLFSILQTLFDLSKKLDSAANIQKFETMFTTLESTREAISSILDEINEVQFEIRDDFVPEFQLLIAADELCCHIRMAAKGLEIKRSQANSSVAGANTGTLGTAATAAEARLPKLPKIDLPEFSGDVRQWQTFHSLFKSLIHNNQTLSSLEKIHYLVGRLRGSALAVCAGLSITGDNYDILYKMLTDKYENKRLLANTYLQQIMDFKPLNGESEKNLNNFLERFDVAVSALKKLKLNDLADFMLLYQALSKLDGETVKAFEMKYRNNSEIPTYSDLINFVQGQSKVLQLYCNKTSSTLSRDKNNSSNKVVKSFFVSQPKNNKLTCVFCQKPGHYLGRCEKFKALTAVKKYEAVKDNGWCFNCLSSRHGVRTCPSDRLCTVCNRKHHVLLHIGKTEYEKRLGNEESAAGNEEFVETPTPIQISDNSDITLCSTITEKNDKLYTTLLSTAVVVVVNSLMPNNTARFILDSGSQVNLLTMRCCKRLGLKICKYSSSVQGLGSNTQAVRGKTSLIITSRYNRKTYSMEAILVDKITEKIPRYKVDLNAIPNLSGVSLADDEFDRPGDIDGIIGVEIFAVILGQNKILGTSGSPIAMQTAFGYVVMGQVPVIPSSHSVFFTLQEEHSLEKTLNKFWEIEQVPKRSYSDPEEIECEKIYASTVTRDDTGRYTVALPFKISPRSLGDSRTGAQIRLLSLEKRLAKDANLRLEYQKAMQDFIDQGHLTLLKDDGDISPGYYIAHHPVIKQGSTSTPVRVVLDASAPSDTDVSLNDILYNGPKLQTDINTLLLNFRLFKIAMTADIRQMYRQINVVAEHWQYQRLLWRFDPDSEIQTYEMQVVAFGLKSSPFLALRTVKQLIKDEGKSFPVAAKFISRDLYMDDLCLSLDSDDEAVELYEKSIKLFQLGGFDLTKWSTNSIEVLENIPEKKRLSSNRDVTFNSDTKILGIQWDPRRDILRFQVKIPDGNCTKRSILSAVSKCYDPIGLLAPFILFLKVLIKKLWLLKLEWDEKPPDNIVDVWNKVCAEWNILENFEVCRHIGAYENQPVMVLGFADASLDGYGAVVYLRTVAQTGDINVQLVCGKSKVSPAKCLTVPRLELLAALLLSTLVKHVIEIYGERCFILKTLAFSDSTTVLSWLKTSYLKDIFVANRIMQIKENIPNILWYHIAGEENPADCLSRGLTPIQLLQHTMWLNGPSWVRLPESQWPNFSNDVSEQSFMNEVSTILVAKFETSNSDSFFEMFQRVSSWHKILRVMVWILRFVKLIPFRSIISVDDYQQAELVLIKILQQRHFSSDIERLTANKECSKSLRKLRPFLQEGLLRVGGRLSNANLNFSQKHPLILPSKNIITDRLVNFYHKIYLHTGAYLLEAILRQKYWILGGRNFIRNIIHKCNHCFRLKPINLTPVMADLPRARVQTGGAFAHTGVDYFGPVRITLGRRKNAQVHKAYVSLFICMSVKAIHLELVSSLSTAHFMQAFKRFISRRGPVKVIYSDRGTNFVGAKSVLKEINEFICSDDYVSTLQTELALNNIDWKMNTPKAPHMGGLWESNVKAVKNHIYRVIGEQLLTYEEFATLLTQVESLLNSRPLCRLSADPSAPEALTPAHFLTLSPLRGFPSLDVSNIPINRLDRFQLIDKMVQGFWKQWSLEYLTSLQERQKWNKNNINISVGAVVILKTDNAPPLCWPLGVITEVHPGKDGVVRNVTLKTTKGVFTRPVVKICPLPTQ